MLVSFRTVSLSSLAAWRSSCALLRDAVECLFGAGESFARAVSVLLGSLPGWCSAAADLRAWVFIRASSSSAIESLSKGEMALNFCSGVTWGEPGSLRGAGASGPEPHLRGGWNAFCAAGETNAHRGLTGGGGGSLLRKSKALLLLQVFGSSASFSPLQKDFEVTWAGTGVATDFPFGVQSDKGL